MQNRKLHSGFTIVELLIVIVVIGILAAITIVAYNGIQNRARNAAVMMDLANASKAMELAAVDTADSSYPSSLPAAVKSSQGNVLQLAATGSSMSYCINAYTSNGDYASYDSTTKTTRNYLCSGAPLGSSVGGSVPDVRKGVNLVSDFATWTYSGGVSYDSANNQIVFGTTSGSATSPLIRVEGSTSVRLNMQSYATQPSPNTTPKSASYVSSKYYDYDGVTPAYNTSNYNGNGNAQAITLSTWNDYTWSTPTGPAVKYIRFVINANPTGYTSDNKHRNPQVIAY